MHTERIVGLQLQQLLRERGTILRYTFTACLVNTCITLARIVEWVQSNISDVYLCGQDSSVLTFWRRNYFFNFSTLCI